MSAPAARSPLTHQPHPKKKCAGEGVRGKGPQSFKHNSIRQGMLAVRREYAQVKRIFALKNGHKNRNKREDNKLVLVAKMVANRLD